MLSADRSARGPARVARRSLLVAALLGLALASSRTAFADQNWDGDNPFGNFSYNNNWYGDSQPAWGFSNGSLIFNYRNNGSQSSLFYDYGFYQNTNDIIFASTFAAGLTLNGNGNGINFNQRLENNSSFTQTINIPLSGAKNGAGQIELNPVNGDLVLSTNVYNDNSKPYAVYGNNGKTLTVNSALGVGGNASAVGFTIQQNSNVVLNAAQSFGGTTTINNSTLRANNTTGSATGSGNVSVTGGTLGGRGTLSGTVTIASGGKITAGETSTSTGTLTTGANNWNAGGSYVWKINTATSGPGTDGVAGTTTGWDLISMPSIASTGSAGSPFLIKPLSNAVGSSSAVANVDWTQPNKFLIALFTGTAPSASILSSFALDTTAISAFIAANPGASGHPFSLSLGSASGGVSGLYLEVDAAPEPTTTLLFATSGGALMLSRRRVSGTPAV